MISDLIREIGQSLQRNATRTVLTGIAVVWGIFMLVTLLGLSRGVYNAFIYNTTERVSMNEVRIHSNFTTKPYAGYEVGRHIQLDYADQGPLRKENSRFVTEASPVVSQNNISIQGPVDYLSSTLTGTYPEFINSQKLDLTEGRFINELDIRDNRKTIVLSRKNADILFGTNTKATGQKVTINEMAWTVVGVYDHRWRNDNYAPFTTLRMMQGYSNNVDSYRLTTANIADEADVREVNDGIMATLSRLHHFDRTDTGALWIFNSYSNYLSTRQGLHYLEIAMWVIGILTLISGLVGVSNIMFVSIKERTHEIGIRRAIGAKPRSILVSVLVESIVITALFGCLGMCLGTIANAIIGNYVSTTQAAEGLRNPGITPLMGLEVVAFLTIAGALAGFFPALRATKVHPVEALRDE